MNKGGIGYSWFKITLLDEEKRYVNLVATIKEPKVLQGVISQGIQLIGAVKNYQEGGGEIE